MSDQHVSVERLAAYAAGDLDAAAALEVEAHVLLCADCRADVEAVRRVTAELGAVEPVSMPAGVAAQVDAALATERATAARTSSGPVGDVLPMARKRRGPSFAGLAAAAAGVALFAAISVPLVTGGGGDDDGAPTAAGAGTGVRDTATKRFESRLDYDANDPQVALTRALSGATGAPEVLALEQAPPDAASDASGAGADSGAASPDSRSAPQLTAEAPGDLSDLQSDPARLAACIAALSDSSDVARRPLLVDFALFTGRPALIVVFPTVTKGEVRQDRIDFWAVGPRCGVSAGDDDVLHFARFDRPAGL